MNTKTTIMDSHVNLRDMYCTSTTKSLEIEGTPFEKFLLNCGLIS